MKQPSKIIFVIIAVLAISLGIFLYHLSNTYEITSKTIQVIKNNGISEQSVYMIEPVKRYLQLLGSILINFAMAIIISLFFIRYIERTEREEFKNKLLKFQEDTAKDAIISVFKRVIDEEFFNIIQKEVLNAKMIRKNAIWQYDIKTISNDKMLLKRTIKYELHNVSFEEVEEFLSPSSQSTVYSKTKTVKVIGGGKEIKYTPTADGLFEKSEMSIKVAPNSYTDVTILMEQEFNASFIYETHFTKHPIINLQIVVNFPEGYEFSMNAEALSSECKKELMEEGKHFYSIKGGIYKGQGIEFFCQPKSTT